MIYLDNAATSWPKPPEVAAAVNSWFTDLGVSAARGDGDRCAQVRTVVDETRARLGEICGVPAARIAFTSGATESLNLLLRGLLRRGDAVLTTALEHSSVVRPLMHLRSELELELDVLAPQADGSIDPEIFSRQLAAKNHALLVFSHASNVLGSVLDAERLCALAREHGTVTVVDASQTAGALPLAVGADAIAASAHKCLLGPPGLGFIAARSTLSPRTTKQGGTGSAAALDRHPEAWPERLEAGTPNTPAIFGLHAALRWQRSRSAADLQHGLQLVDALRRELGARPDTRVFGPSPDCDRIPVLSFVCDDLDPAEVGAILAEAGIHVRTGFHCAPWIHQHLGTTAAGTVRVSPGPFNTLEDIEAILRALAGG